MKAKYIPLGDVLAGELVTIQWPDQMSLGIKATFDDDPYVVILIRGDEGFAGPCGIRVDNDSRVACWGSDWGFEFEVNRIQVGNGTRPPFGALFLTDAGLNLVCHVEDRGGRVLTPDGKIVRPDWVNPYITDWDLYLRTGNGDQTQTLLHWPIEVAE